MGKKKLTAPSHIKLRDYRVHPQHLEDVIEELQRAGIQQFYVLESFAQGIQKILNNIYDRGFEDGRAAALLDMENGNG